MRDLTPKSAWPHGVYYVKRDIHCPGHGVRHLIDTEDIDAMEASPPEPEATPIKEGTIPDQLARLVCPPASQGQAAADVAGSPGEGKR